MSRNTRGGGPRWCLPVSLNYIKHILFEKPLTLFNQVMVMELLSQWGIFGFMDHVAKVEEFYGGRRNRMQQAAEKHLTGKSIVFTFVKSLIAHF